MKFILVHDNHLLYFNDIEIDPFEDLELPINWKTFLIPINEFIDLIKDEIDVIQLNPFELRTYALDGTTVELCLTWDDEQDENSDYVLEVNYEDKTPYSVLIYENPVLITNKECKEISYIRFEREPTGCKISFVIDPFNSEIIQL